MGYIGRIFVRSRIVIVHLNRTRGSWCSIRLGIDVNGVLADYIVVVWGLTVRRSRDRFNVFRITPVKKHADESSRGDPGAENRRGCGRRRRSGDGGGRAANAADAAVAA